MIGHHVCHTDGIVSQSSRPCAENAAGGRRRGRDRRGGNHFYRAGVLLAAPTQYLQKKAAFSEKAAFLMFVFNFLLARVRLT